MSMLRRLGETLYLDFTTHNPETGNAANADSTPVCLVYENDIDATTLSGIVVVRSGLVGHYRTRIDLTTAAGYEIGKSYNAVVTVAMTGITAKMVLDTFTIDTTMRPTGAVVSDAGNSTTVFMTNLAETAADYWKDCLIMFTSGNLINQVKKISGYNGSTKVITVSSGFTETPSASDNFIIVNF